jgi:hypothetical protein
VQGLPPRGPRIASALVPGQHGPAGALPDAIPDRERPATTARELPALPGPRAALAPAAPLPSELLPGARPGGVRTRTPAQPDSVVFTAACPACGQDCVWSEEREDTRLHAVVRCPCG